MEVTTTKQRVCKAIENILKGVAIAGVAATASKVARDISQEAVSDVMDNSKRLYNITKNHFKQKNVVK